MKAVLAVEFFSGIGAFACAARSFDLRVAAAFDQGEDANRTYESNWGLAPLAANLDSLKADSLPPADLWWLSPPCTPFTVRGRQRDAGDQRAASFLNLIGLAAKVRPPFVMVENVGGFAGSAVHGILLRSLFASGYQVSEFALCPTAFGVPMKRPRHFVLAARDGRQVVRLPVEQRRRQLGEFLERQPAGSLYVDGPAQASFHVVDPLDPQAQASCFTSNYWKCRQASGSLIREGDGRLRRFSAREILNLLGFPDWFAFPDQVRSNARLRLAGNSVDVRAIDYLLDCCRISRRPT